MVEDKIVKLQPYDLSLFIGPNYFVNTGALKTPTTLLHIKKTRQH